VRIAKLADELAYAGTTPVERFHQSMETIHVPFVPLLRYVGGKPPDPFASICSARWCRLECDPSSYFLYTQLSAYTPLRGQSGKVHSRH